MMGGNEDDQGNVYEMLRPTRDVRCQLDDTLIMHGKKGVLDMQGEGMMREYQVKNRYIGNHE